MQTTVNKRVFVHNGLRLQDPDSALSPAAVKDLFSAMYPELLNAEIQGPEISGDELVHTFHRTTGTKGATKVRAGSHTKARAKKSPFVRRLDMAAGETSSPTAALSVSKLKTLRDAMTPVLGSPSLSLPSGSFALLL